MSRMKLPSVGIVGQYHDDRDHAVAAAEHMRSCDGTHTEAYRELARRGEQYLAVEATNEDLVS